MDRDAIEALIRQWHKEAQPYLKMGYQDGDYGLALMSCAEDLADRANRQDLILELKLKS